MRLKTDYICVVDLEATCWEDKLVPGPNGEGHIEQRVGEIIEIGAVMLAAGSLINIGEFQSFVRPVKNPKLSDFCIGLTSIKQADVDAAKGFVDVWSDLCGWLATYSTGSVLFASQGLYDYRQLMKDCAYHVVPFPFRGDHMNLKEYDAHKMGWSKRGCGQAKMMARLGLVQEGTAHRGIDDARMAAKILQKIGYDGSEGHWYRATAHDVVMANKRGGVS